MYYLIQVNVSQVKAELLTNFALRFTKRLNHYEGLTITHLSEDCMSMTILNGQGIKDKKTNSLFILHSSLSHKI